MSTEKLDTDALVVAAQRVRDLKAELGKHTATMTRTKRSIKAIELQLDDAELDLRRLIADGIDEGWEA